MAAWPQIILTVIFFFSLMSIWGIHSTADLYFFATTKAEDRLNLGIVVNITRGLCGMLGAIIGGYVLGSIQDSLGPGLIVNSFRIYFSISIVFFILNLFLIQKLPDVSDFSIIDLLSIIISPKELKGIYYLNRLIKPISQKEEEDIVAAMGQNASQFSLAELQHRLESPSIFVRQQALQSLRRYPPDRKIQK